MPESPQDLLVQRIRETLQTQRSVREKRMFGGVAFMVDGGLAVSAGQDGDLLVRVDPAEYEDLLAKGGQPAFMGSGRPMGQGWLNVPAVEVDDDKALAWWIAVGLTSERT